MKAYIQVCDGIFVDDWAYAAYIGFLDRGWDVKLFEDVETIFPHKNNYVVAFIPDTLRYFERLKLEIPHPLGIPDEIKHFAKRSFEVKTLKQFRAETNLPVFVKPYNRLKQITAGVIRKQSSRKELFHDFDGVDDQIMVMTSDVVNMVTEYRCFVLKGELVGVKHYIGDFDKFIDCNVVREAIGQYKSAPVAYTIDFALNDKNETILIECNDAWAIGHYGLDPQIYTKMLIERWNEMIK